MIALNSIVDFTNRIRAVSNFEFLCALALFVALSIIPLSEAVAENGTGLNCDSAYASPESLWPPNHKYKNIQIMGVQGGSAQEDLSINVGCIRQDEPLNGNGDGNTSIDAEGVGSAIARVRAERQGGGNGRVYHIGFTATDASSGSCKGVVVVDVASSKKKVAVDDGPLYGSSPEFADCKLVETINTAPAITSSPVIKVSVGSAYEYQVIATDGENDPLTYQLTNRPLGMSIDANGLISWTSAVTDAGPRDVSVLVTDTGGLFATQEYELVVEAIVVELPPLANAQSVTGLEDTAQSILLTGSDPEGAALTYTVVEQPQEGVLSGSPPALLYTPNTNFFGSDSFSFSVSDGVLISTVAIVDITIAAVNDVPTAESFSLLGNENVAITLVLVGSDSDSDALTYRVDNEPANGTLSRDVPNIIYTPNSGFSGTDQFAYSVSDGEQRSAIATIDITIDAAPNESPTAQDIAASTIQDTEVVVTLLGSDPEGESLLFEITSDPSNGALSGAAPDLIYTPAAGFSGRDTFSYNVSDGELSSEFAVVSIMVEAARNLAPIANAGVDQESSLSSPVVLDGSASSDPENVTLNYQWVLTDSPVGAQASIENASNAQAQLVSDTAGQHTIQLVVNDGELDSAADTVLVTLQGANESPVANAGSDQSILLGASAQLDGGASSDPDGDSISYRWQVLSSPENSQSGFTDSTAVNPTFFGNSQGEYQLSLIVNDGTADSQTDEVTISIVEESLNSSPVARASWIVVFDERRESGNYIELFGNASFDPDGDELTFQWTHIDKNPNDNGDLSDATFENARLLREGFDVNNYYEQTFQLVVSDGRASSEPVQVTVPQVITASPFVDFNAFPLSLSVGETANMNVNVFGDEPTYQWRLVSQPNSSQAVLTSTDQNASALTLDVAGEYVVELVTSFGEPGHELIFIKTIRAVNANNQPPEAILTGPDSIIVDGSPIVVTLDGSTSFDPDGDELSFQWQLIPAQGSSATLDDPTSATPSFVADVRGGYFVELTVDDGQETSSEDIGIDASSSLPNSPPVANAGPDMTAVAGESIQLDASSSSDADYDPLSFEWFVVSVPAGSNAGLSDTDVSTPVFTPDIEGTYTLALEVYDWSDFTEDEVVITVTAGNIPPVAVAKYADESANPLVGQAFSLDASQSFDPDGGQLSYLWLLGSAPNGSSPSIMDASSVAPTFVADVVGDYTVFLTVNDGDVDRTTSLRLSVYVEDNQAPIAIINGPETINVGEFVTLDGSAAYDPDGDPIRVRGWGVVSQPASSSVSFGIRNRDKFGVSVSRPGAYIIGYAVSDGQLQSETTLQFITAVGDNQLPIANAGPDRNVFLGQTVALNGRLSSDPDGQSIDYLWSIVELPQDSDAQLINFSQIIPSFLPDVIGRYVIELTVSDGVDSSVPDQLIILVSDTNIRPIANAGLNTRTVVNRNLPLDGSASSDANADTLVYRWSLSEGNTNQTATLSDINSVTPSFTAAAPGDYSIELVVNDGFADSFPSTILVTVLEENPNNSPPIVVAGYERTLLTMTELELLPGLVLDEDKGDVLSTFWTIQRKPAGSDAGLLSVVDYEPIVVLDLPGTYEFVLTVSDGYAEVSDLLVVQVVSGPPSLPDDPGITGNDELFGYDQNQNYIRDDVERFIHANYGDNEFLVTGLEALAKGYQTANYFYDNAEGRLLVVDLIVMATNCIGTLDRIDQPSDVVTAEQLNTKERLDTYLLFEEAISGLTIVHSRSDSIFDPCLLLETN